MRRKSPVRVVHVVGQLEMGGMEKLLIEFARHVDRSRFDLRFVSLEQRGSLGGDIEALGWPVTPLMLQAGLNPRVVLRLSSFLRRWRAEVVHTHNTRSLFYAGPAARLAGVPCVIHTRHGQDFQVGWSGRLALRIAARTADKVVCVSQDSARLAADGGIRASRIRTVWNGIDLSRFRPALPGGSGPAIAVGRLSPEKDFATLVRAAALVAQQEPTFRLWIAGDGSCRESLQSLAAELRLGESVRFLGEVRDIAALLAQGSLFAMSSLTEGVSLTLLEAMASGLPVAATRVGGNPEVVEDGRTGLLAPPADPAALADVVLRLWRDPHLRESMGRGGYERVETCFDVRKMVKAYEALYLAMRRRRRFCGTNNGTRELCA